MTVQLNLGFILLQTELAELAAAEKESRLNNFVKSEKNIVSSPLDAFKKGKN